MQSESVTELAPGLRRLRAPNPSPMTYTGTNTYILGTTDVAVIDPGPDVPEHLETILRALPQGARVSHILITHSHLDHSPLARPLAERTGAPICAAGPSDFGRSAVMERLAEQGTLGGGEGVDAHFSPDVRLSDGDRLTGAFGDIEVLATPGHMANHLSFAWREALFSGDLVMGWSTSLVSPPDGDMTAFMASLAKLRQRRDQVFHPGHGDPVHDPKTRLDDLIAHRKGREAQILASLNGQGPATAASLAAAIYTETPAPLLPAATRNVLAHLIDLVEKGAVRNEGTLTAGTRFSVV